MASRCMNTYMFLEGNRIGWDYSPRSPRFFRARRWFTPCCPLLPRACTLGLVRETFQAVSMARKLFISDKGSDDPHKTKARNGNPHTRLL